MKKQTLLLSKALLFLFALNIFTNNLQAEEKPLKIAVINLSKIESDTLIAKDIFKKTENKQKELTNKLMKKKQKLDNDIKSLESKRAVLSGEELQKKANVLQEQYRQLQIDEQKYTQILNATRLYTLQDMQEVVSKATNKIAAGKYDLVVPTTIVLYMDSSKFTDITKEVVSKTNDIAKTVDYEKSFKQAERDMNEMLKKNK